MNNSFRENATYYNNRRDYFKSQKKMTNLDNNSKEAEQKV